MSITAVNSKLFNYPTENFHISRFVMIEVPHLWCVLPMSYKTIWKTFYIPYILVKRMAISNRRVLKPLIFK